MLESYTHLSLDVHKFRVSARQTKTRPPVRRTILSLVRQ